MLNTKRDCCVSDKIDKIWKIINRNGSDKMPPALSCASSGGCVFKSRKNFGNVSCFISVNLPVTQGHSFGFLLSDE